MYVVCRVRVSLSFERERRGYARVQPVLDVASRRASDVEAGLGFGQTQHMLRELVY